MRVTAVLVSHNGAQYLPRTLAAVAAQKRRPDAVVGVDAGSSDNSRQILEQALGGHRVITHHAPRGGFGASVKAALASLVPAGTPVRAEALVGAGARADRTDAAAGETAPANSDRQDWIWLLHDDAAPAPEALAELLQAVERAPSVTIAGCKQLDWDEPRRLVDVGLSISRWAERLTLIDLDELDQGQYNGRSDMFAVNSAGMLVRRDVWDQLDGFDPAVPGVGDDVDLCWRNRLAGNRVVVVPTARMFHVGHRPHALGNPTAARKAQVHLRLKHAPAWQVPFLAAGALLGSILRFVLTVLAKDPAYGASQLVATVSALLRPAALIRSRRSASRTRKVSRNVVRGLRTPRREVWAHRRSLLESLSPDDVVGDGSGGDTQAYVPSGDSSDDFAALATSERGWVGTGALVSVVLMLAASLISFSRLIGADAVAGGGMLPLSATLGEIWHNASSWWVSLDAGIPGHGDPFDYVLWALAALGLGNGSAAAGWTLLLALPLAALGAWFAAAALTRRRWPRFVAALAWAGAPVLHMDLAQGRLAALLAHVMIPWVVLGMIRAVGAAHSVAPGSAPAPSYAASAAAGTVSEASGKAEARSHLPLSSKPGTGGVPSWTAAAASGLGLAVVTAAAPLLLPVAVVAVLVVSILAPRRARTLWWSLLPSAALFLPFVVSTLDHPRALLADPGQPLPFEAAPLWQQLLGQPIRFDPSSGINGLGFLPAGVPWALIAALVFGAPVVCGALVALLVTGRKARLIRALWLLALVSLAAGWAAGGVAVAQTGNTLVAPFSGPAVSVATFALLGAALAGTEALLAGRRKDRPAHPARRTAAVLVGLAVAIAPLLSTGLFTARNIAANSGSAVAPQPGALGSPLLVRPATPRTLPATATDRGTGPEQTRTLVLSTNGDGAITSALMHGAGTTLDRLSTIASARSIQGEPGAESLAGDDGATAELRTAVATIVAGTGVDPRAQLERLGAGFVVLQRSDTAAELLSSRIDSVPGLSAVGQTDAGWLWRVNPPAAPGAKETDTAYRARIVDGKGQTIGGLASGLTDIDAALPPGSEDRQLVLAERADPGWAAYVDGKRLTATSTGWAQSFTLPGAGGQLTVRYENPWAGWLTAVQVVVVGLTVLLAIPMRARRRRSGISRDEGALRRGGTRG